jgi:hypothetical protein
MCVIGVSLVPGDRFQVERPIWALAIELCPTKANMQLSTTNRCIVLSYELAALETVASEAWKTRRQKWKTATCPKLRTNVFSASVFFAFHKECYDIHTTSLQILFEKIGLSTKLAGPDFFSFFFSFFFFVPLLRLNRIAGVCFASTTQIPSKTCIVDDHQPTEAIPHT